MSLYNVLHARDCKHLEELGDDNFKPQAERVVRRLATMATVEGWANAKLRAEIKRAKDPKPASDAGVRSDPVSRALVPKDQKLALDMTRAASLSADELLGLASGLTQALKQLGFKRTVVSF